jgi:Bacterial Ig domain
LLTLNDDGSFLYTPDAGYVGSDSFTYMASDGTADSNVAMVSIDIDYVFAGFFPPVDNPPVANGVKAGKAVPIKFSLGGDYGLDIVSAGYPTVKRIPCVGESDIDNIEEAMTAGSSGLHYDAQTGQYTYVWKTAKRWAGTCRQFQLMLDDGTTHVADFVFK